MSISSDAAFIRLAALQIRRSYRPSMQAISILSRDLQLGFYNCIIPNQLPQQKDIWISIAED